MAALQPRAKKTQCDRAVCALCARSLVVAQNETNYILHFYDVINLENTHTQEVAGELRATSVKDVRLCFDCTEASAAATATA